MSRTTPLFNIWSRAWNAWWRSNGGGYTSKRAEAGIFTLDELEGRVGRYWRSGMKRRRGYSDIAVPVGKKHNQ